MWLALALVGCKGVEPAPKEFDDLMHYFWQKAEVGADAELAEGLVNLADVFGELDPPDGSVTTLSNDEIAMVGVDRTDADEALGLFMSNTFGCNRPQLEASLSYKDQDELHTTTYEDYDRTFDNSRSDWLEGATDVLTWDVDYSVAQLGIKYDAQTEGFLRRVPDLGDDTPYGSFLVARTHFPRPAEFENDNNRHFQQDYQLEIYWFDGGQTKHVYALWRDFDFGGTYKSGNETAQRLLLNALYDWDDETEAGCAEGLP